MVTNDTCLGKTKDFWALDSLWFGSTSAFELLWRNALSEIWVNEFWWWVNESVIRRVFLTLHREQEDSVSTLDEVSAQCSGLREENRRSCTRTSEILRPILFCYLHSYFTWIIPEELSSPWWEREHKSHGVLWDWTPRSSLHYKPESFYIQKYIK